MRINHRTIGPITSALVALAAPIALTATATAGDVPSGSVILSETRVTSDYMRVNGRFGEAVALGRGLLIVGETRAKPSGWNSTAGKIHFFDAGTNTHLGSMFADRPTPDGAFGAAIAIGDGAAVVGAPGADQSGPSSGSAYVIDTKTFEIRHQIYPDGVRPGARFGNAVAADGTTAIVGARFDDTAGPTIGGAYLFDMQTGEQIGHLTDPGMPENSQLGQSVAIGGGVAVIGSPVPERDGVPGVGVVIAYDVATGEELRRFYPDTTTSYTDFGVSVATDGQVVLVGAPFDDLVEPTAGAVYVFDLSTGEQIDKFGPVGPGLSARFGSSLSLSGGRVAVGAPFDADIARGIGAAYVYDLDAGEQVGKYMPRFRYEHVSFGQSVAMDGSRLWVGDDARDVSFTDRAGAVFDFTVPEAVTCPLDMSWPSGSVDFFDVVDCLVRYNYGNTLADFGTPFGVLDFFDVAEIIRQFNAGCP